MTGKNDMEEANKELTFDQVTQIVNNITMREGITTNIEVDTHGSSRVEVYESVSSDGAALPNRTLVFRIHSFEPQFEVTLKRELSYLQKN